MRAIAPYPPKPLQLKLLFFLLFITGVNCLDRSALSFAILSLQDSFGITNQDFGFIGGAFGIGYASICFISGLIVDRYGSVPVWAIGAVIWSIATMLMGLAEGFWSLFFLRIILGLAEGVHYPAMLRTISDWIEPGSRGRFLSIACAGVEIATIFGSPFLGFLVSHYNWRFMFILLGIVGATWALIWYITFSKLPKLYPRHHHLLDERKSLLKAEIPMQKNIHWKEYISSRYFIGNCINFFAGGYLFFFALTWLPGYLIQTYHLDILHTGWIVAIPWTISAIFKLLGGVTSDALLSKTKSIRIALIIPAGIAMLLAGVNFFLISYSHYINMTIALISLGFGFSFLVEPITYNLNAAIFKKSAATAQGICNTFCSLAGIIAPSVTGILVHKTGNFNSAFILISVIVVIAFFNSIFLQREDKHRDYFI